MNGLVLNSQLLQVPLYIAGKCPEQIGQEPGSNGVIKLGSNENPLGPSPLALAALRGALETAHRYPGAGENELRRKLAAYHGGRLGAENFIIGNGATDILRMIAQAFISAGGESVTCQVSFPLFALLTTMYGGRSVQVAPCHDYQLDLAAMAEAITPQTRLVWLCSPNNPTGLILKQRAVDEFIEQLPEHIVVVFDEAYVDFVTDAEQVNSLRYVHQGRNVITVRSFSKSAGLAGLRVGYGIARPDLIAYLSRTVLPFNTSALALVAASASLDDHVFLRQSRELVQQERQFLYTRLTEMGLTCLPSQANFVVVLDPPGGAPALVEALLHRGIIIRPMGNFGLPNALRVTVGLREQNRRFLEVVRTVLPQTSVAPS